MWENMIERGMFCNKRVASKKIEITFIKSMVFMSSFIFNVQNYDGAWPSPSVSMDAR